MAIEQSSVERERERELARGEVARQDVRACRAEAKAERYREALQGIVDAVAADRYAPAAAIYLADLAHDALNRDA